MLEHNLSCPWPTLLRRKSQSDFLTAKQYRLTLATGPQNDFDVWVKRLHGLRPVSNVQRIGYRNHQPANCAPIHLSG